MNKNEVINVFVSGGSVTVGNWAGGCCPAEGCSPKDSLGFQLNSPPCTWSYRLAQWLNSTFEAHVNFYNIGDHGRSSVFMVDELATKLSAVQAKPFTSSDLIFLDHSVNDNAGGVDITGFSVENAMEMLIRRIYHHSEPKSLPTIVILDADPRPHNGIEQYPYYQAYEKVGRHYDIPVWSYRDSVLSTFSNVNQSQYVGFLNFSRNIGHDTHPGWPVHLFMADLYAGIFKHDTEKWCDLNSAENRAMYALQWQQRKRTMSELPLPLSANATFLCEKELLSLSYDIVKENLSPVGSYRFEPERGGWNLSVDMVGRSGGFLVTNAATDHARVVFSMNISTRELVEKKVKFQLFLHYLRSYDNGGKL